jgi:antitoxin component YwqK of YwqJK toxin-antitoxin module
MKTNLTLLIILLSFSTSFSQETKCECYSKSGVQEKTGIGGWTSVIGKNDEGEQLQYHFYVAYFPPQELCIPRGNVWWREVETAMMKAIKSHPIYKSSQMAIQIEEGNYTANAEQLTGAAFITQAEVSRIEKMPGTIVSVDAYIQEHFASKLDLCSDIDNKKNSIIPNKNIEKKDFPNQKNDDVASFKRNQSTNVQNIDKEYQEEVQNAISTAFDNQGNFSATSLITSLPSATNKTQAYSNLIMTGSAILGEILQSSAQEKQAQENEIINRREQIKNGIGDYNNDGNKNGLWIYFYLNTTAPKLSGLYKNGKKQGIWEHYENQDYNQVMIKKIEKIIVYENDIITANYEGKFVDYSGQFLLSYKGNYIIDKNQNKSKYGLWKTYNKYGVNLSSGNYNLEGKETGFWTYGHIRQGPIAKLAKKYKKKAEVYFNNGHIDGKKTTYYQNGNIEHQLFYIDGLLEGIQKSYYENGQLYSFYSSRKGKLDGKSKDYYDDGKLRREEHYDNGVKIKIIEYDKNGSILNKRVLSDLISENEKVEKAKIALSEFHSKEIELYNNAESVQYHSARYKAPRMIKGEIIVKDSENNNIKVSHYQDEEIKIYTEFFFVKINNKIAIINSDKEIVIPANKFDEIIVENKYFDEVAIVSKDNRYGAINKKGKILLPLQYDFAGFWGNKTFWVEKDGLLGLINEKREIILPVEYEYIGRGWLYGNTKNKFHKNKTARIKKNEKWGWINQLGEIVVEPKYDETWSAELENLNKVRLNDEIFYVNKNGERIK